IRRSIPRRHKPPCRPPTQPRPRTFCSTWLYARQAVARRTDQRMTRSDTGAAIFFVLLPLACGGAGGAADGAADADPGGDQARDGQDGQVDRAPDAAIDPSADTIKDTAEMAGDGGGGESSDGSGADGADAPSELSMCQDWNERIAKSGAAPKPRQ